jgi:acetoin utilization protein AcuB
MSSLDDRSTTAGTRHALALDRTEPRSSKMTHRHAMIRDFMSRTPVVISPAELLGAADRAMRLHRIRHVVVCDDGKVVGILSERDVHYAKALRPGDDGIRVADAMSPFVYTVAPESTVSDVAQDLADAKYGAAVVVHEGAPVGVFTSTDAFRVLASVLSDPPGGSGLSTARGAGAAR